LYFMISGILGGVTDNQYPGSVSDGFPHILQMYQYLQVYMLLCPRSDNI
jgi:hypothetical protein